MSHAMAAIVTSVLARASPTVRIAGPIRVFRWAKRTNKHAKMPPIPATSVFPGGQEPVGLSELGKSRAAALHAARAARGSFPESADTAPKCFSKFQKRRCLDIPTFNSANPRGITPQRKAQRAFGSVFDLTYCILCILLCVASKHSVAAPETSKKLALALLTTVKFHCRIVIGA